MKEEKITGKYGWDKVEEFLLRFNLFDKYSKLIQILDKELNIAFHKTELLELEGVFNLVQITLYMSPDTSNFEIYVTQAKAVDFLMSVMSIDSHFFVVITKKHNGERP